MSHNLAMPAGCSGRRLAPSMKSPFQRCRSVFTVLQIHRGTFFYQSGDQTICTDKRCPVKGGFTKVSEKVWRCSGGQKLQSNVFSAETRRATGMLLRIRTSQRLIGRGIDSITMPDTVVERGGQIDADVVIAASEFGYSHAKTRSGYRSPGCRGRKPRSSQARRSTRRDRDGCGTVKSRSRSSFCADSSTSARIAAPVRLTVEAA